MLSNWGRRNQSRKKIIIGCVPKGRHGPNDDHEEEEEDCRRERPEEGALKSMGRKKEGLKPIEDNIIV